MTDYGVMIEEAEMRLEELRGHAVTLDEDYKKRLESLKAAQEIEEELTQKAQKAARESADKKNAVHAGVNEMQDHARQIVSVEADLAKMKREKAIADLIQKQKPFWEILEHRVAQKHENLDFGLEGLGDKTLSPAEYVAKLKTLAENSGFSQQGTDIRSGETIYNQYIKKICEMQVDTGKVPTAIKEERIAIIDRYLGLNWVQRAWN
jgi:DNA repair exonuclease SbcCD ATPase subunit